jgi:hypothetical protein
MTLATMEIAAVTAIRSPLTLMSAFQLALSAAANSITSASSMVMGAER